MGSLLRSQLLLQLANAATVVLALVWVLIVGRWLEPGDANAFFAATTLATMAQSATGAFRGALGRRCAWLRDDPAAVTRLVIRAERMLLRCGIPLALVGSVALALAGGQLALSAVCAIAAVACVLTRALLDAIRAGLGGRGSYAALARNQLLEGAARIGVGIACMMIAPTPSSAVAAYAGGSTIAWLAGRHALGRVGTAAVTRAGPDPWDALPAMIAWNLVLAVAQYADTLWVAATAPAAEAAAYGAAATLLRGFALVALPVQLQLTPQLASAFARGRFDVHAFAGLVATYVVLAAIPLTLCVACPTTVLRIAYGDGFVAHGAGLLPPLACAAMLVHLGVTVAGVMIARGRFAFLWRYGAVVLLQTIAVAIAATHSASAAAQVTWIGHGLAVIVLLFDVVRVARASTVAARTDD